VALGQKSLEFSGVDYDATVFAIARASQGNAQDRGTIECTDQQLRLFLLSLNSINHKVE